jgi:hypothetical protein
MSTAGTSPVEAKSGKKRKVKGEGEAAGSGAATPTIEVQAQPQAASVNGGDFHGESPYIKEIAKYVTAVTAKLCRRLRA